MCPQLLADKADEVIGDFFDAACHAGPLAQDARGFRNRLTDERQSVLMRPVTTVPLRKRDLGFDPVRLGVDDGAIHVPQHGRGHGQGHAASLLVRGIASGPMVGSETDVENGCTDRGQ